MLKDIMYIPSFYADEKAAIEFFNTYGFHAEYDFISSAQCDELIQASAELQNGQNGTFRPTLNPHTESDNFLKVMKQPKLISLVEKLVGGKVSGIQTQFFFGRPGTSGFSIHQDNFFVEAKPADCFVSTWLALTDVNKENGTIFLYPGAHKEGLLPVRKLSGVAGVGQEYNASNEESIVPEKYAPVLVEVPKGTLIFLHSLVPHGSYGNVSGASWRQVMLNNYIKQKTPFRPGNSAKRHEIALYDTAT
jgi:ectoine hydroxylase-related dioxygenase (phytanoyl-CoA dioxygenase family)